MKKIIFTILSFCFVVQASAQTQEEKINLIFQKLEANYGTIKNGKYKCEAKFKNALEEKDTTFSSYEMTFQKANKDNFNLFFSAPEYNSFWVTTDKKAYSINHKEQKITEYAKKKWLAYVSVCENSPFMNMKDFIANLKGRYKNKKNEIILKDDNPKKIVLALGNKFIVIDRESYQLQKVAIIVDSPQGTQYEQWTYTYQDFNNPAYDSPALYGQNALPINYVTETLDYKKLSKENNNKLYALANSQATDWKLPVFQGDSLTLNSLRGKTVLLDFWYQGCYPCVKAIPFLEAMHQKYKKQGLVVLGLNSFDKNKKSLAIFVEKHKVTYPILLEALNVAQMYKVSGYPVLFFIDKEGKIAHINNGYTKSHNKRIEKNIQKLLK